MGFERNAQSCEEAKGKRKPTRVLSHWQVFSALEVLMLRVLPIILLTSCATIERNTTLSYSNAYSYSNQNTFCATSSSLLVGGAIGTTLAVAAPVATAAVVGVATAISVWWGNEVVHGPNNCIVKEELE